MSVEVPARRVGMVMVAASMLLSIVVVPAVSAARMPCCQEIEELREACHYICDNTDCSNSECVDACKEQDCDYPLNNTSCIGPGGGCDDYEPSGWEAFLQYCATAYHYYSTVNTWAHGPVCIYE